MDDGLLQGLVSLTRGRVCYWEFKVSGLLLNRGSDQAPVQ